MTVSDVYTREEERQKTLATFNRDRGVRHSGKTAKKRNGGYEGRRRGRRSAHEAWMAEVRRDPSRPHPHPFQ